MDDNTLEALCRIALNNKNRTGLSLWERAQDRLFQSGGAFDGQILLNRVADLRSSVYGELCYIEEKGLQALLELTRSKQQLSNLTLAEVYQLQEAYAPTGTHFIRGLAYWMAIRDHILFVKTQFVRPDDIHAYLHWLLKEQTRTIEPDVTFDLQADFDKSVADVGDIRKLRVAGRRIPAAVGVVEDGPPKEVLTRRRVGEAALLSEQAKRVWEAVLGPERTKSFIEALGPSEYIAADTTLSVKGRRTEQSKRKIKELASELADASDAKVQIEGKDGRVSDGDAILRTRMPFEAPHDGSTLLEFDNVADQLSEVYSRFVRDGKIDA